MCRFRNNPNNNNGCPHALPTWEFMKEFKFDNGAFLEAFRDVFMKVLHHGSDVDVNGCSAALCHV